MVVADEVRSFLAAYPPFDTLPEDELERISAGASVCAYRAGEAALVEDGPPADRFWIVRSGAMELLHQEESVEVLGPGECFGHHSLLTGMAPTFTVRAREDSTCYAIALNEALAVLGRPAGARYLALAARERLIRTGHTVHALPQLDTTRVGELVLRSPAFCDPDTPIREAARVLTDRGESAILVQTRGGLGIVTDSDLRAQVVAGEVPIDAPVAQVMRTEVPAVHADVLAIDATIDMLDGGVEHLAVLDSAGVAVGVISAADLAGLDSHSPFALRHAIMNARDEDALVEAALHARSVFRWLFEAGTSSATIGRVLSLQSDAIVDRLAYLSIARQGSPPLPWAWLRMGSAGRRELTLGSDQDNALAYGDGGEDADAYYERLGKDVNDGLERCGLKRDPNSVLAADRRWRMTGSAWVRTFAECLTSPDNSHLIRATVAFDFRQTAGGLQIAPALVEQIRRAPEFPGFIRQLARVTEYHKPPLNFRGQISASGEGTIDIKRGGIVPLVNLARFHAISSGITVSSTVDRLTAARETGALAPDVADELLEAVEIVFRLRLAHHAECLDARRPVDDLIELDELSPIRRRDLRDALRAAARAQKRLNAYLPVAG